VTASFDYDGAKFLRAHVHDATPPKMRLVDFSTATTQAAARRLLPAVPVRLEGFVARYQGAVTINRFFVACCVADAALLSAKLDGDYSSLPDNSWIEIVARFDPSQSPSASAIEDGQVPSVHVVSLRRISQPAKPYDYLYG
jgi:uncharacterized membrane protein YcgQ (UPF0703/DUF1980 family)